MHGGQLSTFLCRPTGLVHLTAAADSQAVCRHVLSNGRAGGDVCVISNAHWRHEDGIAANEDAFANRRGMFLEAVVVTGDGARSDVGLRTNLGIANISEMRHF